MNNEINPTIKPKPVTPIESPNTDQPSTTTTQQTGTTSAPRTDKSNTGAKVDTPADISYQGKDTVVKGTASTTQKLPTHTSTSANIHADKPVLPQPLSENQASTPPYGALQKNMVQNFFQQQVSAEIAKDPSLSNKDAAAIYTSLTQNTPLPQANSAVISIAQAIKTKAEGVTRKQGDLPKSWTSTSTSASDWTPIPKQPYSDSKKREINTDFDKTLQTVLKDHVAKANPPLSSQQIALLQTAVSSGKVDGSIAEDFVSITAMATITIQETHGLPATWFKDTPHIEDWTPVNLGIVTPIKMGQAYCLETMKNVKTLLEGYGSAGGKIREEFLNLQDSKNSDNANQVGSLSDYLGSITTALANVQIQIERMQAESGEQSIKLTDIKMKNIDYQNKNTEIQVQDNLKAENLHGIMKIISTVMKIVGPILAIAAIAAAALTGGALAGLAVLAVGLCVVTYSVANSQWGITSKIVSGVDNVISKIAPNSEVVQAVIKVALVAVIVVAIIALCCIDPGEAPSVTAKFAKMIAKPLAAQVIIIVVMSSNALPELVGSIAEACGANDKLTNILKAVTVVVELVAMIVTMIVAGRTPKPASTVEATDEIVAQTNKSIQETLASLGQKIKDAPAKIQQEFKEMAQAFSDLVDSFKVEPQNLKSIYSNVTTTLSNVGKLNFIEQISLIAMQAPAVGHIISGAINATILGMAANLTKELGDLKASNQYLTQSLRALDQMVNAIVQSMSDLGQDSTQVNNMVNSFLESLGSTVDKLSKPVRG